MDDHEYSDSQSSKEISRFRFFEEKSNARFDKALVDQIRARPCIYINSHQRKRNLDEVNRAWEEVAESVDSDGNDFFYCIHQIVYNNMCNITY